MLKLPITQHYFAQRLSCLLSFSLTWSQSKSCLSPETSHGEKGHVLYPLHLSGSVTCICPCPDDVRGFFLCFSPRFPSLHRGIMVTWTHTGGSPLDLRMKELVSSSFFVFRSVVRCSRGPVSEVLMGVLCEHDALNAAGWAGVSRACTKSETWLLSKNGWLAKMSAPYTVRHMAFFLAFVLVLSCLCNAPWLSTESQWAHPKSHFT